MKMRWDWSVACVYGKYLRCWEDNVDECEEQPAQPGTEEKPQKWKSKTERAENEQGQRRKKRRVTTSSGMASTT